MKKTETKGPNLDFIEMPSTIDELFYVGYPWCAPAPSIPILIRSIF